MNDQFVSDFEEQNDQQRNDQDQFQDHFQQQAQDRQPIERSFTMLQPQTTPTRGSDSDKMSSTRYRVKCIEIPSVIWNNQKVMTGHRSYMIRTTIDSGARDKSSMDEQFEVWRRYKDFDSLCAQLRQTYPSCIVPPLPDKSLKDKIVDDHSAFVDDRKQGLLRFMNKLSKHRVLGQSDEFLEFVKNSQFYHIESGAKASVGVVTKSLKSLWDQGKSWAPLRRLTGSGQKLQSPMKDYPALDTVAEDDYQREVVIGADLLISKLYNLMHALKIQVDILSKESSSLQRLRRILYSDPMPQEDQTAIQSVDSSQYEEKPEEKTITSYPSNSQASQLRDLQQYSIDLLSQFRDLLYSDVCFYYRHLLSLRTSIELRKTRIDSLYSEQQQLSEQARHLEAQKLRDVARGLQQEFHDLSTEIMVRIVDDIADLKMKYMGENY